MHVLWFENDLTEKLGIKYPILQAPMGEHTTADMAAAVSNSGGLGGLGMWGFTASEAENRIGAFRQQSSKSLNVNYPLWDDPGDLTGQGAEMRAAVQAIFDARRMGSVPEPDWPGSSVTAAHLDMLVRMKPQVVSFHFGLPPRDTIAKLKASGTLIMCSATSVAEAKFLEAREVDFVIAQGAEAGGHLGTFLQADTRRVPGLFSLLPQIVDAVDVPVIAAGGIADGRGIAAALMLGASAVQIGTAFLRCGEANVSPHYRDALSASNDESTVQTRVISGRTARAISNHLVVELEASQAEPLPFPAQWSLNWPLEDLGDADVAGLLAGQSVSMTRAMSSAKLVETLVEETSKCFMRKAI